MEVANISPAISIKFEHNMLLLYIGYSLKPFPTIKPNAILSHKGKTQYTRKLLSFKVSTLNRVGLCTDSQNQRTSVAYFTAVQDELPPLRLNGNSSQRKIK